MACPAFNSIDQIAHRNSECFANPKQRNYSDRAPGLNHLPMADAEAERNHVLLCELSLYPVIPNASPQSTKELCAFRRELGC